MKSIGIRGWVWLITPLLFLMFAQTVWAANSPSLQLSANPTPILVGQQVIVNVLIKNSPLIYGAEAHLIFDPNMLEVVDVNPQQSGVQISPGDFFDPAHSFTLLHQVNNATGKIEYALTLINPAPAVQGDGLLAQINFIAKTQGQTSISIVYGMFGTITGETVAPDLSSMDILINNPIVTPTPTRTATRTATLTPTQTSTPVARTFTSVAAQDGWILESSEKSNAGGSLNAAAATIQLGDDAANRQYRAILSFDTTSLPDGATIKSALLKIMQSGAPAGSNPFNVLGSLWADIRQGPFGTAALALTDFNAAATTAKVGAFNKTPAGGWYTDTLNAVGLTKINKTGLTQLRLYFATDDNNNHKADFMKFFSGNNAANKPILVITYTP